MIITCDNFDVTKITVGAQKNTKNGLLRDVLYNNEPFIIQTPSLFCSRLAKNNKQSFFELLIRKDIPTENKLLLLLLQIESKITKNNSTKIINGIRQDNNKIYINIKIPYHFGKPTTLFFNSEKNPLCVDCLNTPKRVIVLLGTTGIWENSKSGTLNLKWSAKQIMVMGEWGLKKQMIVK